MKQSSTIIVAITAIAVIAAGVWYWGAGASGDQGTVFVALTDATADVADVSDVKLTVTKVELHSAAKGWVTVSDENRSYKLMQLNADGRTELYAKARVAAGTYDKVRATLGSAVVQTKSRGDVAAALPSKYVVMNTSVNVQKNANASVKLDVHADQSLHATSDGQYLFAAVVNGETRSAANVMVNGDDSVSISGGTVSGSADVGVDLTGVSRAGFRLTTDTSLKIQSGTSGMMNFLLGGQTYTQSADASGDASASGNGQASTTGSGSASGNVQGRLKINTGSTTVNGSANGSGGVNVY